MARPSVACVLVLLAVAAREGRADEGPHGWDGRVFVSVSGGFQAARGSATYSDAQVVFREEASAEARLSPRGAPALEVGGGVRVFGPVGLGLTLSAAHAKQVTTLSATVPHPLLFRRPATATAVDSRHRSEVALHIQALARIRAGRTLSLGLAAGPSRFHVRQPLAADAELEPTLNPDRSFTIAMPTVLFDSVSASAWGFHAGADATLRVAENVSIGAVARYSRAVVHVENALRATRTGDRARTVPLELGGLSVTGGLKLWF